MNGLVMRASASAHCSLAGIGSKKSPVVQGWVAGLLSGKAIVGPLLVNVRQ